MRAQPGRDTFRARFGWLARPFWLVWTGFALVFFAQILIAGRVLGGRWRPEVALTLGLADVYTWALACIAAFWLAWRFPLERGRIRRHLLIMLPAATAVVIARDALLVVVQRVAFGQVQLTISRMLLELYPSHLLVFFSLVGVGSAIDYALRYRERELAAAELETELSQARLAALQSQLRPHFLFNTLHSISTLIYRDADAANGMLSRLADLLRLTLGTEGAQTVALQDELDFLAAYLDIQKIRFGSRLWVQIDAAPEVLDAEVPAFLLQPLAENAIVHGFAERVQTGRLWVSAAAEGGMLRLRVADDGAGVADPALLERPGGIGIANTRARLEHLYGAAARMDAAHRPGGGLELTITLPLEAGTKVREYESTEVRADDGAARAAVRSAG